MPTCPSRSASRSCSTSWVSYSRRHDDAVPSRVNENGISALLPLRFAAALAIGLLLGFERGWEQRDLREGRRVAGLRTFGLVSLLGAVAAVLSGDQPWVLGAAMLALGGTVA